MFQDDFLMRQLWRFAQAVAERLGGEAVEEVEPEEGLESLLGTDVGTFERMAPQGLLSMFPPNDPSAARRAVAVSAALAQRANDSGQPDDLLLRACLLIDHAIAQSPALATPEALALQEAIHRRVAGELPS